jgi:hypothetical protein
MHTFRATVAQSPVRALASVSFAISREAPSRLLAVLDPDVELRIGMLRKKAV